MKATLLITVLLAGLAFGMNAFADVLTLKDGRQISGLIKTGASGEIQIRVTDKLQSFPVDQIQSIQFDGLAEAFAPIPPPVSPGASETTPPVAAEQQTITLPSGTEIAVRTIDRIDSKKATLYTEYAASLDDPIIVNGVTIAPANANAFLGVSEVHAPGISRRASLSLSLIAIVVNGQRFKVETGKVDSQSGSRAKRTLAMGGGGAATGAVIGGIAGGAVGAAVGAGVGGLGGAIAGKMTAKGVEIAPETRFSYRLTQPMRIEPERNAR